METTSDSVTSLLLSSEGQLKIQRRELKSIVVIFLENSLFSPVFFFFALKMAEELKPVAFNVEPYQFKLIATESDREISDDIRPTAMVSKVNDRIGKVYW